MISKYILLYETETYDNNWPLINF